VIEGLGHLEALGVEGLYLTPIFQSPSNHRYDVADYFAIDPHLGGQAAFDALVRALDERKMKLVLDGVFNHVGETFFGFREALENPHSPWREAFVFRPDGSYAAFYDLPELPKVDWRSRTARAYLLEALRHWLRKGAAGWRLDCVHQMGFGESDRKNDEVLALLARAAKAENPESYLFAELSFDVVPYLRTGALDGAMHYPGFMHPLFAWLTGRDPYGRPATLSAEELWRVLWDQYAALPLNLRPSMYTLIGSHDAPRALWRLKGDVERMKLALGLLFAYPGAPGIYYGDEIGLSQKNPYDRWMGDPLNRAPFPWDEGRWNRDLLAHVRRLVALKKRLPALRYGALRPLSAPPGVLAFRRVWRGEEVWVFAGPGPYRVRLPRGSDLLSGAALAGETEAEGLLLFLPEGEKGG
jgi:alpha-glucosidase